MITGIFFLSDDVTMRLLACVARIFVHVDRAVMDLDQMLGIIAPGVPEHDVPPVKVCAVEQRFKTRILADLGGTEFSKQERTRSGTEQERNNRNGAQSAAAPSERIE